MSEKIRIDKYIASQTMMSRKEIKKLIKQNGVRVNSIVCTSPDFKVSTETDRVSVNGEVIRYKKYVYYMLNKPPGVLSASEDKKAQTVIDLLPQSMKRPNLFPCGRLDKDTTGLLIITDDGDYAHRVLSPNKNVYKQYIATLDKAADKAVTQDFKNGITLSDGTVCKPAFVKDINKNVVTLDICEGKFHQVKRMFAALGYTVVGLKRVRIGALCLDNMLDMGQAKELSQETAFSALENIV